MKKIKHTFQYRRRKITVIINYLPNGYRQVFINGERARLIYGRGVRPKVFRPDLGVVIKFNAKWYVHSDLNVYTRISKHDKRYFPKLIKETEDFSAHEYVDSYRCRDERKGTAYERCLALSYKYGFSDFHYKQYSRRKSNGLPVYFDYGLE